MIEFRHVYFHYGTEDDHHTSELNDINLRIEDGELI
ncbi:ABC transporter ATP-binding protein, partial [Gardnerella vaginalis]